MILHKDIPLYEDAIGFTAQQTGLKPEYIEKDYWITYALFSIFQNEIGKDTVFKGGTALSKCFQMIERFSEDIDLVLIRHEGETDNKLKSKLKQVGKALEPDFTEMQIDGITQKMGMNRKTAHSFNKRFNGNYGQVRDVIVVEATWLGYFEPFTTKSLISFVGKMMLDQKQFETARQYGLMPFDVKVLEPVRTICEKIMSLVRFSYGSNPIDDLKKKIRHTYDLHQLLRQNEFSDFLQSDRFDTMLIKVANDDVVGFRNNNSWLAHHPNDALVFKDLDNVWKELRPIYQRDFKELVYGSLPDEMEVKNTLGMIRERMKSIQWSIHPEAFTRPSAD